MPPIQPAAVEPSLISIKACEQLFLAQSASSAPQTLGVDRYLPQTERTAQLEGKGWNPKQQPWLLDLDQQSQRARCLLWVDPQLEYFPGHFPGQPILPGVVQLDWSLQLAAQCWPETASQAQFAGLQNLKFKAPVHPAELLALVLTHQPGKIAFAFSSPNEARSQGTLLYRA